MEQAMPPIYENTKTPPPHKLRPRQVQLLIALTKVTGSLNRVALVEMTGVDIIWMQEKYIGAISPEARARCEPKHGYPSLITLGYVEGEYIDLEDNYSEFVYSITDKGRKALETHLKVYGPLPAKYTVA